jgi:hypothetical protein
MNNKQQTAVEYLVNQLFPKALSEEQYYHIQKAKEMEKETIIEFAWECQEMFKHEIKEHFEEKFNDGGNK